MDLLPLISAISLAVRSFPQDLAGMMDWEANGPAASSRDRPLLPKIQVFEIREFEILSL